MRVSDLTGPRRIDLNVDIGEGFAFDEALLEFASSANICCGVHAGSPELTRKTVEICKVKGVRYGMHPGYPDRASMGREPMPGGVEREYLGSLFDQAKLFADHARPAYIKPHGGFYNDTALVLPPGWDAPKPGIAPYEAGGIYLAQTPGIGTLGMLLRTHGLPLMGLPGTAHEVIATRAGQPLIREGFADRLYRTDGTLTPRTEPGAVLQDPAQIKDQVLRLSAGVASICLHGDTPDSLSFAELVYKTLRDEGFEVRA